MRSHTPKGFLIAATAVAALALAGCSSTPMVKESEVEAQAEAALEKSLEGAVPPINCPGDLEAKAGATITCTTVEGGKTYDVNITVTSVDEDGQVQFDVEVGDAQ